jgi:hypothetical protein
VSPDAAEGVRGLVETELVGRADLSVVERSALRTVLEEQALQESGCTSAECAVEIGRLLSAQFAVVGVVMLSAGRYEIHLEYVDISSGRVIAMSHAKARREGGLFAAAKSAVRELEPLDGQPAGAAPLPTPESRRDDTRPALGPQHSLGVLFGGGGGPGDDFRLRPAVVAGRSGEVGNGVLVRCGGAWYAYRFGSVLSAGITAMIGEAHTGFQTDTPSEDSLITTCDAGIWSLEPTVRANVLGSRLTVFGVPLQGGAWISAGYCRLWSYAETSGVPDASDRAVHGTYSGHGYSGFAGIYAEALLFGLRAGYLWVSMPEIASETGDVLTVLDGGELAGTGGRPLDLSFHGLEVAVLVPFDGWMSLFQSQPRGSSSPSRD